MNKFLLSIIIPVFNEEKNISPLLKRLLPVIDSYDYEVLFINDGSRDKTADIIKAENKKNQRIKLISFNRNFGHQKALTCGYQYVKGDIVVSMDADLQDPPEIIPQMIKKWGGGAKIVYAKREKRDNDTFFKRTTARLFYRFINFLSEIPIPDDVGDFRLIDKDVADFLNKAPEQYRFLRGLVAWGGFSSDYVLFKREKRFAGKTNYPLSKMLNFGLEGIISFSIKPLRIATYFGFFSAFIGFLGMAWAIFRKIFSPSYVVLGWATLFVGIMFLGGIQLITIGIIGEYVGKIYQEVQKRPPFLIKEKIL